MVAVLRYGHCLTLGVRIDLLAAIHHGDVDLDTVLRLNHGTPLGDVLPDGRRLALGIYVSLITLVHHSDVDLHTILSLDNNGTQRTTVWWLLTILSDAGLLSLRVAVSLIAFVHCCNIRLNVTLCLDDGYLLAAALLLLGCKRTATDRGGRK